MEPWSEGRAADPTAARQRYRSGTRAERRALREALRADPATAHLGLGVVLLVALAVGVFVSPVAGAAVAGAFAALFVAAGTVVFLRRHRGTAVLRRAYVFTFGWAQWL